MVGTFHEKGTKPLAKVYFSTKIHQTGVLNQKPQDVKLHIILEFSFFKSQFQVFLKVNTSHVVILW